MSSGAEAEDAAEDKDEPLDDLFATKKSSSGTSIEEPSTAAGTGRCTSGRGSTAHYGEGTG